MSQIFISYARDDGSDFAKVLTHELAQNGFTAHWLDQNKIGMGDKFMDAMEDAIRKSFALIVILTPKALESEFVLYEWIYALGTGYVKVLPLNFAGIQPSKLHRKLQDMNVEDFSNSKTRPWNLLFEELKKAQTNYDPFSQQYDNLSPFVRDLVYDLYNGKDENIRRKAIDELAKSELESATDALATAITKHHIVDDRVYASFKLAEKTNYQDERALPGLEEALCVSKLRAEINAVRMLKKYGGIAIPVLLNALQSDSSGAQYEALNLLEDIGDESHIKSITSLLNNKVEYVRYKAINTLLEISSDSDIAKSALKKQLTHSDPNTQKHAGIALLKLGEIDDTMPVLFNLILNYDINKFGSPLANELEQVGLPAIDGFINLLKKAENKIGILELAIEKLGMLKSSKATPHLLKYITHPNERIQFQTISTLGSIGDSSVLPSLKTLLNHNSNKIRRITVWTMGQIGDQTTCNTIMEILDTDDNFQVKLNAVNALGELKCTNSVSTLTTLLQKPEHRLEPNFVKEVILSLGKIGTQEAITHLKPFLNDLTEISHHWSDTTISMVTQLALKNIGTPEALEVLEKWHEEQDSPEH